MRRQAELSPSQRHGLKLAVQLAIVGAIVAAIVVTQRFRGAPLAHDLRERLLMFTPVRALETAAGVVEAFVIVWLIFAISRGRAGTARARELGLRPFAALGRIPTIVALGGIVALAAWFRILLTRAETIPHVFGDELIYTDLAKSIALHGKPLVRGELDIGHSVLYPLLLSPAYRLAANGAGAYVAAKTINAVALSLTAVPTYFLARRVASHGWSLAVAALVVVEPWTAYAALTMTESLFLPAFTTFALILVWMLEEPTVRRQLLVLVGLAILVGIRPQALVFAASVVAAIGLKGLLAGRLAAEIERHAVVLGGFVIALLAGVLALVAGAPVPAGSAKQLLTVHYSPLDLAKWTLWNLGVYELAMGVIALAVFPLALRGLLRRSASAGQRSVGTVALALSAGVVLSVAVLSASRYGLGILHERNVFYATPLVLICLVHWLTHGLERPRLLAAATAAAAVALPATLPQHLVLITNNVDSPTSAWLQQLKNQVPDVPLRAWTVLIAGVAAATFLLMRRPPAAVLSTLLAFVAIAWPLDYSGPFTPKQDQALAWVDRSLPAGKTATLVHVGLSRSDQPCAQDADYEQEQLVTWTEFFNTRVDRVMHVFAPAPGLLPSSQLAVGPGGVTLENGRPFATRYVVLDSRQPIVGRRLARFDLPLLRSPLQQGASLSLWRASTPLTFRPHEQPLPPRADGHAC